MKTAFALSLNNDLFSVKGYFSIESKISLFLLIVNILNLFISSLLFIIEYSKFPFSLFYILFEFIFNESKIKGIFNSFDISFFKSYIVELLYNLPIKSKSLFGLL